jgi:Icc-related predicted phosphoesterase
MAEAKNKGKIEKISKTKKQSKLRILAAGDIHGDSAIAKKLAAKAKREKVDLVVLLGDIHGMEESEGLIGPFKKVGKKVVFVPGNWDTTFESNLLEDIYQIKNLDGYYAIYKDVGIIGLGNPDFQLSLDEQKAFKKLKKNFTKSKTRKNILISHLHAADTSAEFSGFEGSKALRKAIGEFQPDVFLS